MGLARLAPWLSLVLLGCPQGGVALRTDGGRSPAAAEVALEAGLARQLDGWLRWQAGLQALAAAGRRDGGASSPRRRARLEQALLADAGLTAAEAEAVEAVVAGVVAERTVERLSATRALARFSAALGALGPEQRAAAQAALEESRTDGGGAAPALEARFGAQAVQAVLAREAEVTRAWEALLEGDAP